MADVPHGGLPQILKSPGMCQRPHLRLPALGGIGRIVEPIVSRVQIAERLGEKYPEGGGACMKELMSLLAGVCLFLSLAMASAQGQAG